MKTLLLLLAIITTSNSFAQHSFRNTDWNMTRQEVIISEKRRPTSSDATKLVYENTKVGSYDATLIYRFTKIGLVECAYLINKEHATVALYYDDYKDLGSLLSNKYGEPIGEVVDWKDDAYKEQPQYYGLAAATGKATFATKWEKGNTAITLLLTGDNFKTETAIFYRYRFAIENKVDKDDLKDF